ncbi:uncharacterized protein LACBIDRAFT_321044 [Laccaria bicolor S238N-H82]|uniref:Predicted protein n=1 Tax=Laccaria bicolor (strain S238N-H82 / ATCC MYA-4686) TaxID=486041 RepID=B0CNK8_LACBS|nr:uncharacterized protein LACBIDRAFT_321044 [Laccaria bicolor S238N-H82]EDR15943.1 predicted protein [Laccaria bicolor S238N-H82]|eukprot:XP_001874151.1 predicted protein [Laccaria bicolor S238N-H82]
MPWLLHWLLVRLLLLCCSCSLIPSPSSTPLARPHICREYPKNGNYDRNSDILHIEGWVSEGEGEDDVRDDVVDDDDPELEEELDEELEVEKLVEDLVDDVVEDGELVDDGGGELVGLCMTDRVEALTQSSGLVRAHPLHAVKDLGGDVCTNVKNSSNWQASTAFFVFVQHAQRVTVHN